ncbi:hypothetical protein DFP72DRAFT_471812 [Ephemerocybe angulata]|uniref:GST N-terminal domain-containing protein n=1 Tax=Ephemerocybe angulata TaxID=980116 RepID=A0A8H6HTM4_9AGAR|nr:hypothetical protein DFP72DRAFT_471812 [Tulosesus angulatus]
MITLFDIASSLPGQAWSPNTWKTRLSLNYKGIPYKTEWLEYPDIATVLQKHTISPSIIKSDGTPFYSLPAILDINEASGKVKVALGESLKIAEYLDEAYPDTPRLLSQKPEALEEERAFTQGFFSSFGLMAFKIVLNIATTPHLHEVSQEHYSRARARDLYELYGTELLENISLSEEQKVALWGEIEESFGKLDKKLTETDENGPWVFGDQLTFADFVVAGHLIYMRNILGEGSDDWKKGKKWNGGRWERFLQALQDYQGIS